MKLDVRNIDIMNTRKHLLKMSIPLFVEMMLQLLVGNIDQIMISRYSQVSVAAIVNGNQIMSLVIIVLNMISMSTTVILSQSVGANDKKTASKTCLVSLSFITVISIVITGVIVIFHNRIYRMMNVPSEVLVEANEYLLIVASFIIVQGLYLNFAAILRTFTLMKEVMYVSVVMNILNIIGNAILINGWMGFPQMGIVGAAVSTVISKSIGLTLIILLFCKKVDLKLKLYYLKPYPTFILGKLCRIAIPSGIESMSYNVSQMCILGIVNVFGTTVTATKGYCSILANLSYVYAIALSQATQIIMGYLIGSKMIDAIEKRVFSTVKIGMLVCLSVTLLLYLNSDAVLGIFTSDPRVLELGHKILGIEFFLEIGRAINITLTRSIIAVGDAKTPMLVGITSQWTIAFLFAYILGIRLGFGLVGVWIAMALDECIRGLIYVIYFKKGSWKKLLTLQEP